MPTAEGCRDRRRRLWDALAPALGPQVESLVLADPLHLRYLANVYSDPFAYGADYGALLRVGRDGTAALWYESRVPPTIDQAHADERTKIVWYDGLSAARGSRRLVLLEALKQAGGDRIHDTITDPLAPAIHDAITNMRRSKAPDEVAMLKRCMRAGEAGQAWALKHCAPGMTELQVYEGVVAAVTEHLGHAAVVYGDFAVSPGPSRKGGPPTRAELKVGDTLILDFSVVAQGYRSDFTNTLVVGKEPNPRQQRLFDLCGAAMAAGEELLKAGTPCLEVYNAVREVFARVDLAERFPHHAGHGLGLGHPEAPFFVRDATETLVPGNVVTLEPGLYVDGVGGVRLEHNYLITSEGYERLSEHALSPG